MSAEYEYELLNLAEIPENELREKHQELKQLGAVCLNPLPRYQVFVDDITDAFQDKIVVVARHNDKIVAFVSAIALSIPTMSNPVIHSGLTVIHPDHRRSFGVIQLLHGNLWMHLLHTYPEGFWMTALAEVISSLVHMSKFAINVYPSPQWKKDHLSDSAPSELQRRIAAEISTKHRSRMLI